MTIKRYLFVLLATIIVLIATSQLILMHQLKDKMEQEIEDRGKRFANKIIDMTLDPIASEENVEVEIHEVHINKADNNAVADKPTQSKPKFSRNLLIYKIQIEELGTDVKRTYEVVVPANPAKAAELVTKIIRLEPSQVKSRIDTLLSTLNQSEVTQISDETDQIRIHLIKKQDATHHELKKQLRRQMKAFSLDKEHSQKIKIKHKNEDVFEVLTSRQDRKVRKQSFLLDKMITAMTYIIVITSIIGIALVFWLSNKISKPVNELTLGFRRMAKGDKSVKLEPTGIQEMQFAITQFNAMSEQLNQLKTLEQQLAQRSHLEEIGDVSKGIAHALRNPLHTIGLSLNQLQNADLNSVQKTEIFKKIAMKMSQLDKSIAALLTLTSGKIERNTAIALNHLIKDVVLELKQSHQNPNVSLNINLDLEKDSIIHGEFNELRSIIHTLIFNAYEACINSGQNDATITVEKLVNESQTCITVSDNGGGICDSIKEDLFSPHVSTKAEGAGMGLYIAKRIAELYYDGSLSLTNISSGAKATLILRVPFAEQRKSND